MDGSPSAFLKILVPKVPFLLQTAASHTLGLSPTSSKWDLKTEIIIKFIRSVIGDPNPAPVSKQQRNSLKDPGIKGPLWISKVTLPKPLEDGALRALVDAIEAMKAGGEIYTVPELEAVEAEWTGARAGAHKSRPRLDLPEEQHYERMMKEVTSAATVLYFHGGAYFLMDPSSHRLHCSKLAKLTGGRCLSVRYRLSPQNAFPAALLDALIAYLSLLYPPPGSLHNPVSAEHIIFAGDSAGANLGVCLLQLILQIRRSSPSKPATIRFNGQDVEVPVPGGVSGHSPWVDVTRCMPSIYANSQFDYLPPPHTNDERINFPQCDIWPTTPPRGDIYCDITMLRHPLVSPMAAMNWEGASPLWMCYGQECLTDEGKVLARRVVQQGGIVVWSEYEAMPHCFAMILEHLPASKGVYDSWAAFITDAVSGNVIETKGTHVEARTNIENSVDVHGLLAEVSDAEVAKLMVEATVDRWTGRDGETKLLPKL